MDTNPCRRTARSDGRGLGPRARPRNVRSVRAEVVAETARDPGQLADDRVGPSPGLLGPLADAHRLTEDPGADRSEGARREGTRRRSVADDRQAGRLVVTGPTGRQGGEDPAAEDRRADPVAAVPQPVVDPPAGPRPEPRPVVVGDVDRAAPRILDPDVGQPREPSSEPLGGPSRGSGVVGERVTDPAAGARPATATPERDPAVG